MSIKDDVDKLIKKYKTNNPFNIADYMDIIVVIFPLIDTNGFFQRFERNKLIYINKNLPYERRKLVCAHELGHAVMHDGINSMLLNTHTFIITNKYEKEADVFAAYLILDSYDIFSFLGKTYEQISSLTGISVNILQTLI